MSYIEEMHTLNTPLMHPSHTHYSHTPTPSRTPLVHPSHTHSSHTPLPHSLTLSHTPLAKLEVGIRNKDENKEVALGTSKINYMVRRCNNWWKKNAPSAELLTPALCNY